VPPEANEHTSRPEKSGKPWVSRLGPLVVGVGAGALIYGSLYWFPLVNGIDSPFFYPLAGVGFVATIAGITWWVGGPRRFKLKGRPSSWVSWVGYGSLYSLIVVGVVAVGGIGAFATWGLFVTLNGALDSGPATQRSYTVAEFHEDCGGARAKDKSYYLLEPRGAEGGDRPIQARVNCSDDEGLPVDGGGTVPVGGEVVVEVKPGAFGEPWQAGYHRG
jgi:hypothetical protein